MTREPTESDFVEHVEQFIADELQKSSELTEFNVYQRAFQMIINHFHERGDAMVYLKNGYDSLLDRLKSDVRTRADATQVLLRSQASMDDAVEDEKKKYKRKKDEISDLRNLTKEQIGEIQKEIDVLTRELASLTVKNRNAEAAMHEQWLSVQDLSKKTVKKTAKTVELRAEHETLVETESKCQARVISLRDEISDVLDAIMMKKREIGEVNRGISDTRDAIQKQKMLVSQEEANSSVIRKEISALSKELECARKDGEHIVEESTKLNHMVSQLVEASSKKHGIPFDRSDDPIQLLVKLVESFGEL